MQRVRMLFVAGGCLLALPGMAQAPANTPVGPTEAQAGSGQESGPALSSPGVEDIVVTAQFRSQRLQDTPIAITAISGQLLAARGQMNLVDIGRTAPNVTIQTSIAPYGNSAAIAIRGVGQYDNSFAVEPGVGVYIDDVYYPTLYGAQLDLLDLDRVEVLRGPQGTLAGKNSIGGAIKLFSKEPAGTGTGFVEGTVGSFRRIEARAGADLPLVKDTLALRVAGVFKRSRGFLDRIDYKCRNPAANVPTLSPSGGCTIGHEGGADFKGLRAALAWTPTDRLTVDILGDVYNDQAEPNPSRLVAVRPGSANAAALTPFLQSGRYETYSSYQSQRGYGYSGATNLDGYGVSGRIRYRLGSDFSLTSITAYRKYDGFFDLDLDGTSYGLVTERIEPAFRQFSQEVRLGGKLLDGLVDFTAGGYYYRSKGVYGGYVEINGAVTVPPGVPGAALANFTQDDRINARSKSAFVTVGVHPLDGLNLNLGGRYTDESKYLLFVRRVANTFVPQAPLDGVEGRYKGDRFDYRVAVDYRLSPALLVYGSIATGFKGGGVNPRPYRAEQVVPFGQEKLTAYEVGVKSDLFDRNLRLNVSAFVNRYQDVQLNITSGVGIFAPPAIIPVNAGDANVKGVEVEATIRPAAGLVLDGSASYLRFRYRNLLPGVLASGIRPGFITPFTPRWKWSAGAQYDFDLAAAQTLSPRVDASYQSATFGNAINAATNRVPGYTVANARLIYRHKERGITATLSVNNLFDRYYYTSRYDNLYQAVGTNLATVGRPREVMGTLKYDL